MIYSKYRNVKTRIDGIKFDSKKEAEMYLQLKLMEKAVEIKDLVLQPEYILQKPFTDSLGKKHRAIKYKADFEFFDIEKQRRRVIDCKGMKTQVFKIKEKLYNKMFLSTIEYEI